MVTPINSPAALDRRVKQICDILRRSNCSGALQYVPELTWLLFLRFLDEREEYEKTNAGLQGTLLEPAVDAPYRWRDWASPSGFQRQKLQNGPLGGIFQFLEKDLLVHLRHLGGRRAATPRQRIVSQIVSNVDQTRVDTEHNFMDVLDLVDQIRLSNISSQHQFPLSQAYEGLLLSMGEKNNDGGQFFTPREVVRAMTRVVNPTVGMTVYDPCCGTGGFLAQAFEYMIASLPPEAPAQHQETLELESFLAGKKTISFIQLRSRIWCCTA